MKLIARRHALPDRTDPAAAGQQVARRQLDQMHAGAVERSDQAAWPAVDELGAALDRARPTVRPVRIDAPPDARRAPRAR